MSPELVSSVQSVTGMREVTFLLQIVELLLLEAILDLLMDVCGFHSPHTHPVSLNTGRARMVLKH